MLADDAGQDRDGALGRAFGADRNADRGLETRELLDRDAAGFEPLEHLLALRPARDDADPSRKAAHAVKENVEVDVIRVAEQHDVAVGREVGRREEILRPCGEAAARVREALDRGVLGAVVDHRVCILELVAEFRDLETDVTAAADQ
jgi:hypothetical protein